MLRIHTAVLPDCCELQLEGRLSGPWVAELEQCWRTLDSPHVTFNLTHVDYVDEQGRRLLNRARQQGVQLTGLSLYLRSLFAATKDTE